MRPSPINFVSVSRPKPGRSLSTPRQLTEIDEQTRLRLSEFSVDRASVSTYWIGVDGRFLNVNQAACRATGYSRQELLQLRVSDLDPRVTAERWREHWHELRQQQRTVIESTHRRKDGTAFPVEIEINWVEFEGREYHFTFVRDITPRREWEKSLKEAELRYRTLFGQSPVGVLTIDPKTGIALEFNDIAARQLGYTREEFARLCISDYEAVESSDEVKRHMDHVLGEGGGRFETRQRTKDGRLVDMLVSVRPITISGQTLLNCVFQEITDRKQAERQLHRTQRLESIGTLTGGIAHDLNNCLAPILMCLELLKLEHPEDGKVLGTLEASARRGANMVKQLLTFAKGAEGERLSVQPRHLTKEMARIIRETFPRNVVLQCDSPPGLPTVLGDATQLHQVLLNLCVNARDAMPDGGTLTLAAATREFDAAYASAVPEAKPGKYVLLSVKDTGSGMTPQVLERIFEPFFTTKGPDKGTGLGLSTVMGIVKSHGGFIRVYSAPGQGATFNVYLPAQAGCVGIDDCLTEADLAFRGSGESVLVVDDEPAVRNVTRSVLERLNFKVLTAADGADGIVQAAEHRASLRAVITDLQMPHMDGIALARALRRLSPTLPVVVTCGRLEDEQREELAALNLGNILEKPFTEGKLKQALNTALHPGSPLARSVNAPGA